MIVGVNECLKTVKPVCLFPTEQKKSRVMFIMARGTVIPKDIDEVNKRAEG